MATTVQQHINDHPRNEVRNMGEKTTTKKAWAQGYGPLINLTVRSVVRQDGLFYAQFDNNDTLLPLFADDQVRLQAPCHAVNARQWDLEMEADCENWFHTEISNIVLAAWTGRPWLLQRSHSKPEKQGTIEENVDAVYSIKDARDGHNYPLVIGEFKRNLIDVTGWQAGNVGQASQDKLSRELRGYADKYKCPQVFCFDGDTLLLLQFRASNPDQIRHPNCPVDCWVIPRETPGTPLRLALYRLLVQGFRRYQGSLAETRALTVGQLHPAAWEFYSGRPLWPGSGQPQHPNGYERSVEARTGQMMWSRQGRVEAVETNPLW